MENTPAIYSLSLTNRRAAKRHSCPPPRSFSHFLPLSLSHTFHPSVFFDASELKEKFYKGFCKQQLWPLLHYILPVSPVSVGRFDQDLWQSYVKVGRAAKRLHIEALPDQPFPLYLPLSLNKLISIGQQDVLRHTGGGVLC